MTPSRPMKAEDWDESKQRYPVVAMPKIDGVRALNQKGALYGRSLKKHANLYTTALFSHPWLDGFDGEMAAGSATHPRLVSLTSSALSTIKGEPAIHWHVFDLVTEETRGLGYLKRLELLNTKLTRGDMPPQFNGRISVVPHKVVLNFDELYAVKEAWLAEGYEGVILRDPEGAHKQGRSTVREGGFLRIKDFVPEEALVLSISEGVTNLNNAEIDELGYTSRSSHKENLVPNGKVGSMECVVLKTGRLVTVGPGKMPHDERAAHLLNPSGLVGQVIKFMHFPQGVKNKPRFPTYDSIRAESDLDPALGRMADQFKQLFGV